jgi:hypothetical protein
MGSATIHGIMKTAFTAYEKAHKLPWHVRKAARALMKCRTAELGGHMQVCPEGHYERHWYNSCKHRVCPQCNWLQLEQWLAKQKERLPRCAHYHMIFTVPHELNDIWLRNVKLMTSILFKAVRDTLFEFYLDERHVGAKPGIIAALHTWSQTLVLHAHLHCLVTAGGLCNGGWVGTRHKGFLLPVRAVMKVYRGKMLAYLDGHIEKGELKLPDGMSAQRWRNLRNKLGRVKWNVNIRERYDHANGVLIYLARYIRGGAISNKRIISFNDKGVTFRHRAVEGSKSQTMTLPVSEFIQRYLLHVPEPHTKVVRSWGLYAPTAKKELNHCRFLLGQPALKDMEEIDWQDYCGSKGDEHPELCPVCGSRLVRAMEIAPMRVYMQPANKEAIQKAA